MPSPFPHSWLTTPPPPRLPPTLRDKTPSESRRASPMFSRRDAEARSKKEVTPLREQQQSLRVLRVFRGSPSTSVQFPPPLKKRQKRQHPFPGAAVVLRIRPGKLFFRVRAREGFRFSHPQDSPQLSIFGHFIRDISSEVQYLWVVESLLRPSEAPTITGDNGFGPTPLRSLLSFSWLLSIAQILWNPN